MATSTINVDSYSTFEVNFSNNPTTYVDSGRLYVIRRGSIVLLRFVDFHIRNSPSATETLYSGIPRAAFNISSVIHPSNATFAVQSILITGKDIKNFYTVDSVRANQIFLGEIVYFTTE